jgi:hypothetical protein
MGGIAGFSREPTRQVDPDGAIMRRMLALIAQRVPGENGTEERRKECGRLPRKSPV